MLRKFPGVSPLFCSHADHKPPSVDTLFPGIYEHTCEGCGARREITVYGASQSLKTALGSVSWKAMSSDSIQSKLGTLQTNRLGDHGYGS
jgi:hypothetical protein